MPSLVFLHLAISLLGIGSGIVVLLGFFGNKRVDAPTHFFLITTILTSVTGFFLPAHRILPSRILGVLSLIALAVACVGRYSKNMQRGWLTSFVISAMTSLYFNVFVLIAQSFMKVPALHALAPNGVEPPFAVAQGVKLVLFIILTIVALKKFRPA
jgi:hypothetical protein